MSHSFIHRTITSLLDLIWPRLCLGCGTAGEEVCPDCLAQIARSSEAEKNQLALFDYQDPLAKKLIWHLKYKQRRRLGDILGQALHQEFAMRLNLPETTLLIPIPLGAKRLAERGFNQASLIARGFAARDPKRFEFADKILIKIKDTPSQVSIKHRAARLANLAGAFAITKPELIAGRVIILIDDVTTTGGTLAEAKKVLKQAGAKKVITLVLAHG